MAQRECVRHTFCRGQDEQNEAILRQPGEKWAFIKATGDLKRRGMFLKSCSLIWLDTATVSHSHPICLRRLTVWVQVQDRQGPISCGCANLRSHLCLNGGIMHTWTWIHCFFFISIPTNHIKCFLGWLEFITLVSWWFYWQSVLFSKCQASSEMKQPMNQHLRLEIQDFPVPQLPWTGSARAWKRSLGSTIKEVDFWASTTEASFNNLELKAGGKLIFIYCQASVCEMKGHYCLLWHLFHILWMHNPNSLVFLGKAFNEDSVSSPNWWQPEVYKAKPFHRRQ